MAETAFQRAIAVARARRKLAGGSSAPSWASCGARADDPAGGEKRAALRNLLGWFTEGAGMPDLEAARAVL